MKPVKSFLFLMLGAPIAQAEQPLSAIDWLQEPAPITVAQPLVTPLGEPPVTSGVTTPTVTVMPLDAPRPDAVGLLASSTTGLPADLWQASATDTLVAKLGRLSHDPLPAIQSLYFTLLLAEADAPADASTDARFLMARVAALRSYGAVDPALALVERAGPATSILFDLWLDLAFLNGSEDAACQKLKHTPDLTSDYAKRVFCIARSGDWKTAALTFDTANAVGVLSQTEARLLAQFLDPELVEAAPDLAPTGDMTPLIYRLYEAVGAPLPTGNLPREYAMADLRGTAGWKAEIEAAERLTRVGALPANRLLGLYTDRRPAASGGVWDRVRSMQAFDTAMQARDLEEIAATLPSVWAAMQEQSLEVVFATLFGEDLFRLALPASRDLAYEIALLSPIYEDAAAQTQPNGHKHAFLTGLAKGAPDPALARTAVERAIAKAFQAKGPSDDHAGPLQEGRLGQVILTAAIQLDASSPNQTAGLEAALTTLRAVGLEDIARRSALQIILLKWHG